jgi:uncharacterized protein YjbI with pentapeptide repeats
VEQEQEPHERSFIRELVPAWRPTRDQALWTTRITIVLLVLLGILTVLDLRFGLSPWKWLQLAIVPLAVAIVAFFLNRVQRERELGIAKEQRERELGIAKEQRDRDYELANQRAQDTVLQEYLSQMANLLNERELLTPDLPRSSSARLLARSQTLWALWQIDGHRKAPVLRFLHEATLIQHTLTPEGDSGIVWLSGADLRDAQLKYINLENDGLDGADLKGADLTEGWLKGADLSGADLKRAKLCKAKLNDAQLGSADLSDADLSDANLSDANLSNADLHGAFQSTEDRPKQQVTNEELEHQVSSLKGATMPNGQKYEEWLKSKDQ